MNWVTLAWSLTGSVLGMQATAVKPPATADAAPVAIVSLCSWPGSRRCTCMSMRPGVTSRPPTSTTCAAPGRQVHADRGDHAAVDEDVTRPVDPVDRIHDPAALQQ